MKHLYIRWFEILFSLAVLLVCIPLFALIAVGIRLSSPGRPLYIQKRLGKGGKTFRCVKFRTMKEGADRHLASLLHQDAHLQLEWKEKQKLSDDPRVFPFGKFLRKSSLDELPQFWNVLRGDLSLVGPRPYLTTQKSELGPHAFKILSVRPGLTGLWQTSGRSRTTFQERIHLDAQYVEKKSLLLDFRLFLKTIPSLLFPKDAV